MISYQADLIKAKSILDRLLREDPTTMSDKEMKVFVDELADDGCDYRISCMGKNRRLLADKMAFK